MSRVEDIRQVARPALRHRIALNIRGETEGLDADELVEEIIGMTNDEMMNGQKLRIRLRS